MSTKIVDEQEQELVIKIANGSEDELNEMKAFLFKENIRIEMEKKELQDLKEKVIAEREKLREESDEINRQIVMERKRLKDEQLFFDKKMDILRNGFESLEADRRALSNARKQLEADRSNYNVTLKKYQNEDIAIYLFKGVNSLLGLKKRYKDLLKIFHPDNMGGDHEMVLTLNQVYEDLKKNYETSKII